MAHSRTPVREEHRSKQRQGQTYAFIDAQNVHLGVKQLGWVVDWWRFQVYLDDKSGVSKAFTFFAYIEKNQPLYTKLQFLESLQSKISRKERTP